MTYVIDTSGVYIPGHATPTVIIIGTNQLPISDTIRTVMGIKGEPSSSINPHDGLVWNSIVDQIDEVGSESEFVSVADMKRSIFYKHPWSIGGGGTAKLKGEVDEICNTVLGQLVTSIGFLSITGDDEIYTTGSLTNWTRLGISNKSIRQLLIGINLRDYQIANSLSCIYPYDNNNEFNVVPTAENYFWKFRLILKKSPYFGKTKFERGLDWREFAILLKNKLTTRISICFAFVATHNHFVLNKSGLLAKQSAPVIKLPVGATENQYLELLGLLNSSTALFWARQTLFPKGGYSDGKWQERLEWDGEKLKQFPIPMQKPCVLAKSIIYFGLNQISVSGVEIIDEDYPPQKRLQHTEQLYNKNLEQMIALQEELDWQCYNFYKITDQKLWMPNPDDVPPIKLGERAFEIVMARKMRTGELETAWFERHGSAPITKIPSHWPGEYRALVQQRIDLMENNKNIRLIEQPEYKRRWAMEPWDKQVKAALKQWLLNRLEYAPSEKICAELPCR